jgi:acyl-homoserine-lactone acylase
VAGTGFTRQWLQDVLFGNRHYSAEIMLDDVMTLCDEEDNNVVIAGGATVNVAPACSVLANWDRRNKTSSVGTHVWTDFWGRASGTPVATLYAVPFDAADPVNTPRGVNLANAATRTKLMGDLALTTKFFADNNIPLDREWGKVQFDVRNNEAIPIHGGSGGSGVYNAIGPVALVPGVGHPAISNGSSYIQAVTFKDSGPDARAIVTYSQSTDPANPHYADMTKLFSSYGWVTMPFAEGDIRRDPNLQTLHLREKR